MAAYGAATSLKYTIHRILHSSRISLVHPSQQILQRAYEAMVRLQKVLLKLDETSYCKIRTEVNVVDERIKEVVWEFEDLLESHYTNQILLQLKRERDHLSFLADMQSRRQSVDCFVERVTMTEAGYKVQLENMPEEEGEPVSSRIDFGGINSEKVGLSDEFERVKDLILVQDRGNFNWLSVIGVAGVGKTTLAKKVFDDPTIQRHFELRAWVTVGGKCDSKTLRRILAQLDPNIRHQVLNQGDDDDGIDILVGVLKERLKNKKCLLVMDDVWEWDKRLMDRLPKENIQILLTSRLRSNGMSLRRLLGVKGSPFQVVCLLNEEEREKLLGVKVLNQKGLGDLLSFSVDLQSLRQSVDSFIETVTVMEAEYDIERLNMPEEKGVPLSTRIDCHRINSNMVGLSDEFGQVRDYLLAEIEVDKRCVDEKDWLLVIGMAGVGKTTLAKKAFEDPTIQRHFDFRAWVKVGRKCGINEILRCILAQVDQNIRNQMLTPADNNDDEVEELLEERLKDKKCLIVLDDVWEWDTDIIDYLPHDNVRILVTSRLGIEESSHHVIVRLLTFEESKELLGEKVFGKYGFPSHLEKLGEKIAKKCEGLPLMIVTVAELLSNEEKTPEFWTAVAGKKHNSVFVDAYSKIYEVLLPSYEYLPQYLKMVFLYIGAFHPYKNIEQNHMFSLLHAEGFLEHSLKQTKEPFAEFCLERLASYYHLFLFRLDTKSWFSRPQSRVHSCWQHLCKKESSKIKFLHVLQSWHDVLKDQRRLCTNDHMLFAFEQVLRSITYDGASTVRSLLCFGPYHHYPVPILAMNFKLLRVLDAYQVRFYHFPLEIFRLVCLTYLALTCTREIPSSISNLFQLQVFLIKSHENIKKRGVVSYLPMEMWDMQELICIDVTGRDLPISNGDTTLDKLHTLSGVSTKSCTRKVLRRIPNLKSLLIIMELEPYADDNNDDPLSGLDYISQELLHLEALKFLVVNPEMMFEYVVPFKMFPSSLTLLKLGGTGCSWQHLNDIGSLLPNLKELFLHDYAFRGPEWNIVIGCFSKLETLVIQDTDLVRWSAQRRSLSNLKLLSLQHCYKLQQLEWKYGRARYKSEMHAIELIECNPMAVSSANQLPESLFTVRSYSSFC
ncbi:disease resistance RPP8-like protein 3 [Salvia hispanica]|uniref:disease resistance RPP8-like protein 3 n=1 Tax=Salvia hispanica TaxID=49212 RepID=UPI002009ADD5|nr:disease resistance RPP8-like protein 3 [Salvia hispanica]